MVTHIPTPTGIPAPVPAAAPTTPERGALARTLARCYLRYVSAVWRGDPTAARFAEWIDAFWTHDLPQPPADVPDAISPHGGAGHGISWFEGDNEVLGYVNGVGSGYRVPFSAIPSATPPGSTDPCWRNQTAPAASREAGADPNLETTPWSAAVLTER